MNSVYCTNCERLTFWQRRVGITTLILFLSTVGLPGAIVFWTGSEPWLALLGPAAWCLVLVFVPRRCSICGSSALPKLEEVPEKYRSVSPAIHSGRTPGQE